jgi:phosphoserine phosphatase RsbU/P
LFFEPGSSQQSSAWHHFLALGEKLMALASVSAQADLIKSDIQTLGPYDADVWFTDILARVPGNHNLALFPPIPPSPLMQKVVEDQRICVIGKGGHPKQYSGGELPYVLAYPLIVKDSFLGIIQVTHTGSDSFKREEVDLLEGLAANVAVAMQVSHQTIIKNWRWEQLSLVRTVSQEIANVTDLDELCQKVTAVIRDTFHYYAVNIFTIDPGSEQLHFHACAGPVSIATGGSPVVAAQLGKGIVGHVAASGMEILANDVKREPRFIFVDQLPLTKAEVVLPIKVEDRVLGILDVQSDHIFAFHEMDVAVLRSLADNIALAVEGARLYSTVERRVEQLSTVSEVGKALSSILDFDQLLKEIVTIISDRFEYPYVHLFLVQKDTHQLIYRAGSGERARVIDQTGLAYDIDDTLGIIPWVARNGATIIANDVATDPHYRPAAINPSGTSSEMAVPLIFGKEVLGVMDIQSDEPNQFDAEDRVLFEALGGNIAVSIRNSILYNSERWRRQAADSLQEVAGLLSSNIALDKLLDTILTELEQILPCEASAIWLVNEEDQDAEDPLQLRLASAHGVPADQIASACCNEPLCMEWLQKALLLPQPNVRSAQDPFGPLGKALGYQVDYSSIAAPMRVNDRPVGLITLAHPTPNRYGFESIRMTQTFASYAAVAIQNARLFSSAQEQAWIATVLLQVAEATQSITNVDDLLQAVVRLTPMLVGVRGCAIFLRQSEAESYSLAGTYGIKFMQDSPKELAWFKPDLVPALQQLEILKAGFELAHPDRQFPILINEDGDDNSDPVTYSLLPLLSRGDLMGACLVAFNRNRPGMIELMAEERQAIIQGIAHQTAIAIENIRLIERQQQETYVSAVLLQVAQTVVSHKDLSDVLASITQIVPLLVGSEICVMVLWDEDQGSYRVSDLVGMEKLGKESILNQPIQPDKARLLEFVCGQSLPVTVPLSSADPLNPAAWLNIDPTLAISTEKAINRGEPVLIGVPLAVKGDTYGAMLVVDSGQQELYFSKRMEIISGIAQQTSMAIQNDRLQNALLSQELLASEFKLAREIQQTFLPDTLPQPEGWEVDARWRPARDVGGDFYDIFWISPHKIAVVIADVSDKGISAALYMTLTRTLLRTVAQQEHSPGKIFASVNELLLRDTPHGMYITALLCILDLKTGKMVYANAGHNLPIIWREDGQFLETLRKGSMPLGIIETVVFTDQEISLQNGDTILFYTDGITETFSAKDIFGEERLNQTIQTDATHSATSILESIDRALMVFQGSIQPSDDVTALTIHRK